MKPSLRIAALLMAVWLLLGVVGCGNTTAPADPTASQSTIEPAIQTEERPAETAEQAQTIALQHAGLTAKAAAEESAQVPGYTGSPYTILHDNQPTFTPGEKTVVSFETYSPLDELGRCGVCTACVGKDIMPTEKRGEIGQVKPTGWHTVKYDCVDGKYLYNRCHLIGFQLTGENANERNLITGTRYLNVEGMLPFENMVADYVKETGNHVLYRVTPVFHGDDPVAAGVVMEGYSVEDKGEGICFYVYCYNVQPGVIIDYTTGDSRPAESVARTETASSQATAGEPEPKESVIVTEPLVWITEKGTKYHSRPTCGNMQAPTAISERLAVSKGYAKCSKCW